MRRLALTTALTGLALAWAVAPAAGQGGPALKVVFTGGTIYHREAVPPGKGHVFHVTCPPGYKPVFGAPASFDPTAPLKASVVSLPGNAWLFRYDNTGTQPTTVTVMVLCAKPRPAGAVPPGVKRPLKIVIKKRRITTTVTYAFDQGGKPVWALFAGQETPVDLYAACTQGSMRVLKRP